jgi:hypothetical protein
MLLAVLYIPVSGGRPALPVPSPVAMSLLAMSLLSLVSTVTRPPCGAGTTLRVTISFHLQQGADCMNFQTI